MPQRVVIVLAIALRTSAFQERPVSPAGYVVIRDAHGHGQGAFAPRKAEYEPALCCPFRMPLRPPGAVAADGKIISGFGYYAWPADGVVQVRVVELVPAPGAPNRFLDWTNEMDRLLLQPRDFALLKLKMGQSRSVDEMKARGLDPVRVTRVGPRPCAIV